MNKNIKRIVAIALTVSAFSAIAPAININFMTTKAYAADDNDEKLSELSVETSSGSTIKMYEDSDYDDKIDNDDIEDEGTYYVKTSSSKIKLDISGPSTKYVRVFKGTSSSTKGVKVSSTISLSSGSNTIKVLVYSEDPGSSVKYKDDDDKIAEYTLKVKCTASSSDDDDDDETGDVYLKSLSLSDGDIDFSKKTSTYDVNVAESVSDIKITAKPDCDSDDYDDYEVRIDGTEVDESDKFKKEVSLSKGKNTIKITVEDDDDEIRTYTLNINRGGTTTNTDTNTNTNTNTTVKINQWVTVNGRMQYNDSLGNPLKNQWIYSDGKYYYLGADGYKITGWTLNSGRWYYLDANGVMQTGWQYIGGTWYMLDASGAMLTGWYKDFNGKWYYLQASGAMAKNTTIAGYKLGSDGAWIR